MTSFTGRRIGAAALLLATLALGIYGIQRGLWLDEAWVANSVLEPSLSGMFYYPEWLQSTPPLFLLLVRAAVGLFGVSNAAFRIVPLAFALLAVAGMIAVARRLLSEPFAMLAAGLMAFHATTIEYSRSCKQYSAELAMSAVILLALVLYLEKPSRRRFVWLAGVFVIALPLAWASVFLLPGATLAVWARGGIRRAGLLAAIVSAQLAALWLTFIRGNVAPELRAFWTAAARPLSPGMIAVLIFCVGASVRAIYKRNWFQIAALSACLLFVAAGLLRLYPNEPRSRMFLLPCVLLVAASIAQDLFGWMLRIVPHPHRIAKLSGVAIGLLVVGLGIDAARKQVRDHRNLPDENYQAAVAMLRQNVKPGDLLLVHASVREGFRLYTAMEGWRDNHARFGSTGFPCCARNRNALPDSSDAGNVQADIDRMVPSGYKGRLWLFYSDRHSHWVYVGMDESALWIDDLRRRSCRIDGTTRMQNVAITPAVC